MAQKNRVYTPPKKLNKADNEAKVKQRIYELAADGISKRSIAVHLGCTLAEFHDILDYKEGDICPFGQAYDAGMAQFELHNVAVLEDILENGSTGQKMKIALENRKTLENWAPATRTVKVEMAQGPTEFSFEEFSPSELEHIAARAAEQDKKPDDASE